MKLNKILSVLLSVVGLITVSAGLCSKAMTDEEEMRLVNEAVEVLMGLKNVTWYSEAKNKYMNETMRDVRELLTLLGGEIAPTKGGGDVAAKKRFLGEVVNKLGCVGGLDNDMYDGFILRFYKYSGKEKQKIGYEEREYFLKVCTAAYNSIYCARLGPNAPCFVKLNGSSISRVKYVSLSEYECACF